MGKIATFMAVMGGATLLFYFMGLLQQTPNTVLLNFLLDPVALQDSEWYVKAITVLEIAAASAILVGAIITTRADLAISAPFAIFMFNLFFDFLAVYSVVAAINVVFAILLIAPLMLIYVLSIVEWFRGVST